MHRTTKVAALAAVITVGISAEALAVGESTNGFPNWAERVHLQLANRARVDPQLEMTQCGANCAEAACYSVMPPLRYKYELNRAARFHAAHLSINSYFAHTSACTLVSNIDALYPGQCAGDASCSCEGGTLSCMGQCTSAGQRVGLFNTNYGGEIIAGGSSPNQAFYLWLYEDAGGNANCMFTQQNGHRWLLLTSGAAVGFGVDGRHVGDFGGGGDAHPIASGSHWPRSGGSVEAWANWYDAAGPTSALINVDGECTPMTLTRGTPDNGAYKADLSNLSGCSRYFFLFEDGNGTLVTYPETGSLGIGPAGSCDDWNTTRPTTGPSCNCAPQCAGLECGDDSCGGSCGNCVGDEVCDLGICVGPGTGGGNPSGGGSAIGGGGGSGSGAGGAGIGGDSSGPGGLGANSAVDDEGSDDGGLEGSCGCRSAGDSDAPWQAPLALWTLAGLAITRRRSRACTSPRRDRD